MAIQVVCACGKRLKAPDELGGKKAKCPGCGEVLVLPRPTDSEQLAARTTSVASPVATPRISPAAIQHPEPSQPAPLESGPRRRTVLQRFVYLVLLVALVPLAVSVLHGKKDDDVDERVERTLEHLQETEGEEEEDEKPGKAASVEEFFNRLPGHRIEGALLAHESWMHWGFAIASGAVFFAVILLIFPRKKEEVPRIFVVGIFTATIGILLLLAAQWIAGWTQGRWFRGGGLLTVILYIAKFIGFSYRAALDPETGFLASCFGFTLGVGLCEEICKAIPLLYRYKTAGELPIKTACLWGLASGVGFGVSEGITYSSDFYNGIYGGEIYLIRFASCVALHAVWSGAVAVTIHRQQHLIHHAETWWEFALNVLLIVSIPMVLHGLYDTLLKKEHEAMALLIALASFGWLVWQIEAAWSIYGDVEEEQPGGLSAA